MFLKCLLFLLYIGLLEVDGGFQGPGRSVGTCPTPTLVNGKIRMRQRSRLVKFTCNPHYKLVGSRYSSCRNGRWDEDLPVCIRPGCNVTSIQNGIYVEQSDEAWIAYFCLPGYTLVGSSIIYCDGTKWNATAPRCAEENKEVELSCDFEKPDLCGWTQDELHDFDWKRYNKKTPSSFLFTGPSFDHTFGVGHSGYYMYIESTSRLLNDTARLLSPVFDKELAKDGCFSFYYHMYGVTCGGLRVYQKPDRIDLQDLLRLSDSQKKKYTLFERWGNLGDTWLLSITNLTDFDDNFQIVIEGIRGTSFTSDIAVDDVAILRGGNCSAPTTETETTEVMPDSCVGRCVTILNDDFMNPRRIGVVAYSGACMCNLDCFDNGNCCNDFMDTCIFSVYPDRSTSEIIPETQKLIATKSEPPTTTAKKTTTVKPTTTTQRPTTTRKPTTTQRPTTTRKPITTRKPTTTTVTTTRKVTTLPTTVTTKATTTSPAPTTTGPTNTRRLVVTTDKSRIHKESMDKERKEKSIELMKTIALSRKADTGMSSWKVTGIVLAVITCLLAVVWAGMLARSERGHILMSRLRGTVRNDNEVRFLSANEDDF